MHDEDDDPFAGLGPEDATGDTLPAVDLPPDVAERVRQCAALPLNDTGNAQRFRLHFGDRLLFVEQTGWHEWDGRRWRPDDEIAKELSPRVRALAQEMGPLIAAEAAHVPPAPADRPVLEEEARLLGLLADLESTPEGARGPDYTSRLLELRRQVAACGKALEPYRKRVRARLTHAKNAGNSKPMSNMVNEAIVHLGKPHDAMDAAPLDVNTLSGVLRFSVDRGEGFSATARVELVPHTQAQMITKLMPVDYVPGATCPRFDAFLAEVQPDPAMRAFLLRWIGLSMTALRVQALSFWYGGGANGKTVLSDIVARILGGYAAGARIKSLTGVDRRGGGDATPDLMLLVGARFVRASEPAQGVPLQEDLIKELTGGEPMQVRALHTNFITFEPFFKLTIQGNHKPEIRGTDDGIWRRIHLVPWDVQIPPERRVEGLAAKLVEAEGPGILNRFVEGLLDYLEGGLQVPAQVAEATQEYRHESDPVGVFLDAACLVTGDSADSLLVRDVVDAFNFWLAGTGAGEWRPRTVQRALAAKAGRWRSAATGHGFRARKASSMFYDGIRFLDVFGRTFRDAPRDQQGRILRARPAAEDAE